MVKKAFQNPKGGLNAAGRKHFNVKAPVKAGDNPRRASFLARMAGVSGPMKDENGKPTRKALALSAWGASSPAQARKIAAAITRRNKA